MNGNETIKKLILDDKMNGVLELFEKCDINSFIEIEKYYSGGYMELNEDSICYILRFSIYYNDNRIMLICNKYLKTHMTESIMIEIFDILYNVNINNELLNEFKIFSEENIKMNGYKYLNDDVLLKRMNIECLKFILNNRKLIIKDETWLLNRLLKWYVEVYKECKPQIEENEEILNEFISILKNKIHLNEIRVEELNDKEMNELRELNIEIEKKRDDYICIRNIDDISNNFLIDLIHDLYLKEEEENDIILNDNQIKQLNNEEVKKDMIKLLSNENIKIIEIVLNLIIEMRICEIIPKEIKNELLGRISLEYNKNKRKRSLRCMCIFVDEKKDIIIMEGLCGKDVLYQIINNGCYLDSKSKELLIEYIHEMKLNEKEEEEMSKIIINEELLGELKYKKITSFSYPRSDYLYGFNEEFSIIPFYNGNRCIFSISPSLPPGITINKEDGIIHGKVKSIVNSTDYEVVCRNKKGDVKFTLSLDFNIRFRELNKSSGIIVSNDGKTITNTNNNNHHCYFSVQLENGVYHIKIKLKSGEYDDVILGLSTNNTYSGNDIHKQPTTCNYVAFNGNSYVINEWCHIGTVVNENPNFNNHGDGSIYEIIIDMNKREFSISHNDSNPVLLVKDLPSPLYPYAGLGGNNSSFELIYAYFMV